jgi:2-polyprenyl-3-methyl-5-hydroxy-6-metoxy-1,4-benzoquinol methylase
MEVKERFPFKGYMDCNMVKYITISEIILKEVPKGSRVLDIGCGPCDLTAILSKLGYSMTGIDDLRDPWHLIGRNRDRIKAFAKEMDIQLINESIESVKLEENTFDAVLLIDILEHSLNPRTLLNRAISALKVNGLLLIETPNSVSLAKRILSLMENRIIQIFALYTLM